MLGCVLVVVLVLAAVAVVALVMFGMLDPGMMPLSCPKCFSGGSDDVMDQHQSWYASHKAGRVYCRSCHTWFREHPDGSLVEDRTS